MVAQLQTIFFIINNGLFSLNNYYIYGIGNFFKIAFDLVTNILWNTQNGPNEYNEVNVIKPDLNNG